ncbi:translesion DNA synthesis-associated protein ImuA [Thiomonas sp. FB-Cd]|uniref:translesion DNA synthesis-associated protein ImuA n=1 Tax=Thiomonas sp. FB-Cd TaxID=1158292 RepID=UPI0004DF1C50|nr:translesion DNA synthesis-associated protein ImuA [Thiomonas sp. FB-Cd]
MSAITRHLTQPLPSAVAAAIWRGSDVGQPFGQVIKSGWLTLDRELPGGGWPCGSLSELLSPQATVLEWRLLGTALSQVVAKGGSILLVGPPKMPYLPGLQHIGVEARHLVWVQAETSTERLWAAEQLIQADTQGAILIWLPQARPEQLRRLQSHAQGGRALLFAIRPEIARHEASPASLRVLARCGPDWALHVQILKRRGPAHAGELSLLSIPGGLRSVLTSRARKPSNLLPSHSGAAHAVGRVAIALPSRRLVAAA